MEKQFQTTMDGFLKHNHLNEEFTNDQLKDKFKKEMGHDIIDFISSGIDEADVKKEIRFFIVRFLYPIGLIKSNEYSKLPETDKSTVKIFTDWAYNEFIKK